jgi:hypothetical protein
MQNYIDNHPVPLRPTFNELSKSKVKSRYPTAFATDTAISQRMLDIRAKKPGVISAGLWPLDVHSYSDWHDSGRSVGKTMASYIAMAKIEMLLISSYRADLIKNCPHAAFIRQKLAISLDDFCKVSTKTVINPMTKKSEARIVRKFYYADRIHLDDVQVALAPPDVDVHGLKERRQEAVHAQSLLKEAVTCLTKFERLKAVSAAPASNSIDKDISRTLSDLRHVSFLFQFISTSQLL